LPFEQTKSQLWFAPRQMNLRDEAVGHGKAVRVSDSFRQV